MGSTPLVWLYNCSANVTLSDLKAFAEFGHAIGPDKVCARRYAASKTCRGWALMSFNTGWLETC